MTEPRTIEDVRSHCWNEAKQIIAKMDRMRPLKTENEVVRWNTYNGAVGAYRETVAFIDAMLDGAEGAGDE